jgi:hypothetical protein
MMRPMLQKIGRALRKDPRYIARRLWQDGVAQTERWRGPRRASAFDIERMASARGYSGLDELWQALREQPYAHPMLEATDLHALQPDACCELERRAQQAHRHEVDLLGSGAVTLPSVIDWHTDLKTGYRWPPAFYRDIDYNNLDRPSDVKMAWELSRLQWALPLGQTWRLSGEDRHAAKARDLIEQWIDANPYGASVNWACTMEPALRILTWTWLFHACADAPSWADVGFRKRFLSVLYLHGDFVARNLERADINGNHYTADAAGLIYAGLFFGTLGAAPHWATTGWEILSSELPRQVFADGVDFEASVPYHRLVLELFALPALYRKRLGLAVPNPYRERLIAMGRFSAAYSRPDGSVPLWGDADDARALPLGTQALNDHRYLAGLMAVAFDEPSLLESFAGPRDEVAWLFGISAASRLPARARPATGTCAAFRDGGFYIMRDARNHVFIDCGPLGLAGRGGHGHNDLLSFEAMLDGVHLISDCGAYLYTASPAERNHFRSTACHNTPQVDGQEINRFFGPRMLWVLRNDARHELLEWSVAEQRSRFEGRHDGYSRLPRGLRVRRAIELDHAASHLTISDRFEGTGEHKVVVPWHFAPGVEATLTADAAPSAMQGQVDLLAGARRFALRWQSDAPWRAELVPARVSPSYGVAIATVALRLTRSGTLHALRTTLAPTAWQHRALA